MSGHTKWSEIKRTKSISDEEEARKARLRKRTMLDAALTVLLEGAGGSVTFTDAEYQGVRERYGGASTNIRLEVIRGPGVPPAVRVTLETKRPANAETVS